MKLRFGVCSSIFVVASAVALIAASKPGQSDAAQTPAPAAAAAAAPAVDLPIWAYSVNPPAPPRTGPRPAPRPPDDTLLTVPGSSVPGFTKRQIGDLYGAPDWFPDSHPAMPPIVAEGRKPEIGACGHCHLPNGFGRPENSSIVGLSASYMTEQFADFKSGARHSSEPRMDSVNVMIRAAKAATPEEIKAAVDYFTAVKPLKWIRVVETDQVPKTKVSALMLVAVEPAEMEPIGDRVIEMAENLEQTELRNNKSGFVAYVPKGTLKTGENLVKTGGGGKTMACVACHGANLKGTPIAPTIAGRSPSTMTRQLIDFQTGARNGPGAAMMKPVVANLKNADIVALTGYLASLEP
jgi:cytochrome c553